RRSGCAGGAPHLRRSGRKAAGPCHVWRYAGLMAAATTSGRPRAPIGAGTSTRRDPSAPWRHIDLLLIAAGTLVPCFGVVMVYSATRHHNAAGNDQFFMQRQAVFVALGLGAM